MNPRRSLVEAAEQIALNEQFKLKSINYKPKSGIRGVASNRGIDKTGMSPRLLPNNKREKPSVRKLPDRLDGIKMPGMPDRPGGFRRDPGFNIPDTPDRGPGGVRMPGPDFSGDTPPKGYMVNPIYKPREGIRRTMEHRKSDQKFIPDNPINRLLNSPRKSAGDTKRPSVAPVPSMYDKFKKFKKASDARYETSTRDRVNEK